MNNNDKDISPMMGTFIIVTMCIFVAVIYVTTAWATWTNTFDTATPTGANAPSVIDDHIRLNKLSIQERLNACMHFPLTGTSQSNTDAGKFREVIFTDEDAAQSADGGASPSHTPAANEGILDIKDSGDSKRELWWWDEDGNNTQLTKAGALYLAGTFDQEMALTSTANTVNGDVIACTDGGYLTLPLDSTDTTEANLRYNTTDDTVEFRDSGAWDPLMSVATTAIANAAYGSASGSAAELSIDVGFAPDFVIAWNSQGGVQANRHVWMWHSSDATGNKSTAGDHAEAETHIEVDGTELKFPVAGMVNTSGSTMYYFALNFRASVQNPS